jgi:hypothetical protein
MRRSRRAVECAARARALTRQTAACVLLLTPCSPHSPASCSTDIAAAARSRCLAFAPCGPACVSEQQKQRARPTHARAAKCSWRALKISRGRAVKDRRGAWARQPAKGWAGSSSSRLQDACTGADACVLAWVLLLRAPATPARARMLNKGLPGCRLRGCKRRGSAGAGQAAAPTRGTSWAAACLLTNPTRSPASTPKASPDPHTRRSAALRRQHGPELHAN